MATIKIVKFKVRRGTDAQRRVSRLDQGELGFTTDTKRLFVGNGVISGGYAAGSKVHPPLTNVSSLVNLNAEIGDLAFANNLFYQLTASSYDTLSSWANVGPRINTVFFEYDGTNTISLKDAGISADKLNPSNITGGLVIDGGNLKLDLNTSQFAISGNKLTLNDSVVTEDELNSTAFTNGLTGGSGSKVGIKFDAATLYLKYGDTLSISAVPAGSFTFSSIDSDWIGAGLVYDLPNQQIKASVTGVDLLSLALDLSGKVSLQSGMTEATNELAKIVTDTYGRVTGNYNSIYDSVSCLSSTDVGPLSSIFNGSANQLLSGFMPNVPITVFTVLSANSGGTVALNLSSAGFLMFESDSYARQDNKYIGRFAIPIFVY